MGGREETTKTHQLCKNRILLSKSEKGALPFLRFLLAIDSLGLSPGSGSPGDLQPLHHLGTCWKCTFSGHSPELLNQKILG